MYLPPAFAEPRLDVMHALMREYPLATLICHGASGLQATPLPFQLVADGRHGVLRAHCARANPLLQTLGTGAECLVAFNGPQGYVTPSWYASKAVHGKVVPTWNYVAVHAWGPPRLVDDVDWLRRQIGELTAQQEARRDPAWKVEDAPAAYIDGMLSAIVGIEIGITRLEGKWKLSQNRDVADRAGVVRGLLDPADPDHDAGLAGCVARARGTG
jgi:transcriptional regulator